MISPSLLQRTFIAETSVLNDFGSADDVAGAQHPQTTGWLLPLQHSPLSVCTLFDFDSRSPRGTRRTTSQAEASLWSIPALLLSCEFDVSSVPDIMPDDSRRAGKDQPGLRFDTSDGHFRSADLLVSRSRPVARLAVKDSGGAGLRAQLFRGNQIEINPDWLDFAQFDSLNMCMADVPSGPSGASPQFWRSTFTIGLGSDWRVKPDLAIHLGYRYYNNAMPDEITAGALPSANQHVVATAVTYHRGAHAVTFCYGLDLYDPAASIDASAQRATASVVTTAHLVSLTYRYSF